MSAQRNNRTVGSSLTTPHITLEIPSTNYGQFLSPIHEVPTPLSSPSHTPVPTLRRQSGVSDSSSVSNDSPPRTESKRLFQQNLNKDDNISSDDISKSSCISTPSIIIDNVDGDSPTPIDQSRPNITVVPPIRIIVESDSPTPSPLSSPSPSRTKPPPLHIVNSNFSRFEAFSKLTSMEDVPVPNLSETRPQPPRTLPVLCISEPSPVSDSPVLDPEPHLTAEGKSQTHTVMRWEHVSIGSPPIRKHSVDISQPAECQPTNDIFRRGLKEAVSSSLDLPNPPPLITITSNFSEVESDSDAGTLGRGGMLSSQNKMCYLSPFACYGAVRPDMAASESNLSSSGYSSMASPGPSPSCSSKTLHASILEEDMAALYSRQSKRMAKDRQLLHRIVLSPSLESSTDDQIAGSAEPVDHESTADYDSNDEGIDLFSIHEKIDSGELRSAKEVENFMANAQIEQESLADKKLANLIRVQKSSSLDSKLIGQRWNNIKVIINPQYFRLN